jgi:hypothetical protein
MNPKIKFMTTQYSVPTMYTDVAEATSAVTGEQLVPSRPVFWLSITGFSHTRKRD